MSDEELGKIADGANLIINGYAFTKEPTGNVRVLNLNNPSSAAVLTDEGEMLETSMDDIELGIAVDYYKSNREYLEA